MLGSYEQMSDDLESHLLLASLHKALKSSELCPSGCALTSMASKTIHLLESLVGALVEDNGTSTDVEGVQLAELRTRFSEKHFSK